MSVVSVCASIRQSLQSALMIIESSSCAVLQDEVGLIARTTDQRLYPHDVPRFVLSSLVEKNLGPSVDD
jgi:hypothetical protein